MIVIEEAERFERDIFNRAGNQNNLKNDMESAMNKKRIRDLKTCI